MEKPKFIIGIDPDVNKSGFALLNVEAKKITQVEALSFPDLIMTLNGLCFEQRKRFGQRKPFGLLVVIEDSDDTTNWHLPTGVNARAAAAIGHNVGLCHATQRHIKEWAENLDYDIKLIKPLKKEWMGRDGKITQEEIMQFIPGLPKKMNQECRDAALLAWNEAGLPICIPAGFYQKKFSMENLKHDALKEFKEKTKKEGEFLLRAGLRKTK